MNTDTKIVIGIGLLTAVIIGGGVWFSTRNTTPTTVDASRLVRSNSIQTASAAPVTLVEFGDFQCPSCAAVQPVVNQLMANYKDRVNFVFRHFPLPMHKNAVVAAKAAEAAQAQGKFWEMNDLLFEHQTEWAESSKPEEFFIKYAEQISLNMDTFKEAIASNTAMEKINQDKADGTAVRVTGTPTFFINGQSIVGGISYNGLKAEIEKHLGQ